MSGPVRLWDLPVRLVHWSFVVLVPAMWASAEWGKMTLHMTLGLILLGLVLFRLAWGVFGSSTARFAGFVKGPAAIRAYIGGLKAKDADPVVGHNPLGALSVLALIGLLALQLALGLIAQDTDGLVSGPLSTLVSYDVSHNAAEIHGFVFNVILAVVVLHIVAIAYYARVKKENLIQPMITGSRTFDKPVEAPVIAPLWRAMLIAVLAAILTTWIGWGAPPYGGRWPWEKPKVAEMPASDYM